MAKRKFSFLADENEKYEQEYYRELAEEKRMQEAEAKKQLANKGKHGVSMVSGNSTPIVGEKNTYHIAGWYEDTPQAERNPAMVTWELFKKRSNGKFTSTNIKKNGDGTFTFGEMSIRNTYRLEAYLYRPEGGGLIINPKPSATPRIGKVELHYVDDKKSDTFSFYDRLRAKAHTTGMPRKELVFILWEDDSKGGGHSAGNQPIEIKSARVQHNGLAVVEFTLTKGLMQKAMKGEADAKEFEFYVTVEYYKGKTHDSKNINVRNPFHKVPEKKVSHPKASGSPAEQKPPSKREEKNLLIHQADGYLLHDWAEVKGKAQKNKDVTVNKTHGRSTVGVKSQPIKKREGKCLCQQYDLVWGNKVSCEFRKKVVEICADLWGESRKIEMANGLMAVMSVETAHTFSASKIILQEYKNSNGKNKKKYVGLSKDEVSKLDENFSGPVGLIQFTPASINEMNKEFSLRLTKRKLALMTEIMQLDYVKKYFQLHSANERIKTTEDIYLHIFAPIGVGKKDDFPLYTKGKNKENTRDYNANKSVDQENNNDGIIQRVEILSRYRSSYSEGLINKESQFVCGIIVKKENVSIGNCPDDYSQCFNYADVWENPEISSDNHGKNNNRFGYNSVRGHKGIDIVSGSTYKDVHSLMCGKVVSIVDSFKTNEYKEHSLGNTLMIKSKDKEGKIIFILYCHLDKIYVKKGDNVKHGQKVALSGSTGNASSSEFPNGKAAHGINKKYWHVHIEAATKGDGYNNFYHLGAYRVKAENYMKTKFDKNGNAIK